MQQNRGVVRRVRPTAGPLLQIERKLPRPATHRHVERRYGKAKRFPSFPERTSFLSFFFLPRNPEFAEKEGNISWKILGRFRIPRLKPTQTLRGITSLSSITESIPALSKSKSKRIITQSLGKGTATGGGSHVGFSIFFSFLLANLGPTLKSPTYTSIRPTPRKLKSYFR